jgi:hypothetical protein
MLRPFLIILLICALALLASCESGKRADDPGANLPADAGAADAGAGMTDAGADATDADAGVTDAGAGVTGADADATDAGAGVELYAIDAGNGFNEPEYTAIVDRDGNVVMRGAGLSVIYADGGGVAVGIERRRYEQSGAISSELYNVSGELLRDFEPVIYEGDSGGLLRAWEVVEPPSAEDTEVIGALYNIGSRYMLIDAASGEPVTGAYVNDEYVDEYMTGIHYMREGYDYYDDDVGVRWPGDSEGSDLVDKDGKILFADALMIAPLEEEADGRALSFVAIDKAKLYALSRKGEIIVEKPLDDPASFIPMGAGFAFADGAVLDAGLNTVVSGRYDGAEVIPKPNAYGFINTWRYMNSATPQFIVVDSYDERVGSVYDIFDVSGRPLWRGVRPTDNERFWFGPDRIVLKQGFKQGLVDTKGAWIYEESVFQFLDD